MKCKPRRTEEVGREWEEVVGRVVLGEEVEICRRDWWGMGC